MNKIIRIAISTATLGTVLLLGSAVAEASHSWGGYHWARTSNPFTLKLGDNVSSAWDAYLSTTSSDWSKSDILDTSIVKGNNTNPKNCRPTNGRVEVCNAAYGNTGWLGVAQVWVNGLHITQGTVKVNDTYFKTAMYNKPAWRNLVMCQEIAHTFGLDHQDTIFSNTNLGTCMDYTNAPAGGVVNGFDYGPSNEHPNQHDYDELDIIYGHLDTTTTISTTKAAGASAVAHDGNFDNESEWGKVVRKSSDGKSSVLARDLGNGQKVFTFVTWADTTAK